MNLFVRLAWLLLLGRRRAPCPPLGPCRTPFRVLPTDLDVLRHVNNGVYLSILDLARVDYMTRAGVLPGVRANGWYPVVVAETITFRRSLRLWQRFEVETVVLGWDEKTFYLHQRFLRAGEPVAEAVVRARFLARTGGSVSPPQVVALMDGAPEPTGVPDWVLRWARESGQRAPQDGGG